MRLYELGSVIAAMVLLAFGAAFLKTQYDRHQEYHEMCARMERAQLKKMEEKEKQKKAQTKHRQHRY